MIDWTYIKQLESDVGAAELNNIVALFLDEVDSEIDLLRKAIPTPEMLKSKMHFLKGGAYYLGFARFGDLCGQYETLAGTGHAEEIDLSKLISAYEKSRRQFLSEARNHCSFVAAA